MFTSTRSVLSIIVFVILFTGCKSSDVVGPPADDPNFTSAIGMTGGKLYDRYWAIETGFNQSDPNLARYRQYADFFRCKQCHSWDLLGRAGSYINRAPSLTRPNVASLNLLQIVKTKTSIELFNLIKTGSNPSVRRSLSADLATYNPTSNSTVGDQMPNYSAILSDKQIWDLVKFFKTELTDVNDLYDFTTSGTYPTGTIAYSNLGKGGNAAAGDAYYTLKCVACHGANGKLILVDGNAYTVGSHFRAKPHEDHHKVKFGQLGSSMGAANSTLQQLKDLYKTMADPIKYPNP